MKVRLITLSSASPTPTRAPPVPSTSTMITAAESSSRDVWAKKLRQILSESSSRATSLGSTAVSTRMDFP